MVTGNLTSCSTEYLKGRSERHGAGTAEFPLWNEDELIFQSSHDGMEFMWLNLKTGILLNYLSSSDSYDEPEGIYPDGW